MCSRQVASPLDASQYALLVSMGHGGVVYVNGVVVAVINIDGSPDFWNNAASCQPSYGVWQSPILIGSALLVPGPNVIAVELHECGNSDDLYFAAALVADAADVATPFVPAPQVAVGCVPGSRPQNDLTLTSWTALFGATVSSSLAITIPTGSRVLLDAAVVVVGSIEVQYVWVGSGEGRLRRGDVCCVLTHVTTRQARSRGCLLLRVTRSCRVG